MPAAAKTRPKGKPAEGAAVLIPVLFILIPSEAGGASAAEICNAGLAKRLRIRDQFENGRPLARGKVSARRRIAPCAALIAPWRPLTLPVQATGIKAGFRA
jgi:hypothetical protein